MIIPIILNLDLPLATTCEVFSNNYLKIDSMNLHFLLAEQI